MGILFWGMFWCPAPNVRNTLISMGYNIGVGVFVSTQFDIETYLADLNEYYGGLFAGLYVLFIVILAVVSIWWADNYHSWDQYLEDVENEKEEETVSDMIEEEVQA